MVIPSTKRCCPGSFKPNKSEETGYVCIGLHYSGIGHHYCEVPLRSLVDIDMLLNSPSISLDWQLIIERTRRWRLERCVYLTLRLSAECFGTPLPDGLLKELVPEHVEVDIMAWVYKQFFSASVAKPNRMTKRLVNALQERNVIKRLSMVWKKLDIPNNELSRQVGVHPNTPVVWRFYPLWFCILIRRYGRQVLRLWSKNQDQVAVLERHSNQNNLERWLSG